MVPSKRPKVDEQTGDSSSASVSESEADTERELERTHAAKSRKTLKRKRRATSPSRFGAGLEALLETAAPTGVPAPLSLKPGVGRRQKEEKLERGARKLLQGEKKEREEKGRVRDVIGGWGVEGERALRKVAQRGVITLFNAIQQSQGSMEDAKVAARATRGSGKATLAAPEVKEQKKKPNALGNGKEGVLEQERFLDMIRAGGVVSRA